MKDCPENDLAKMVAVNVGYDIIDYHKQEKIGIDESITTFYVFHKKGVSSSELLN